MSGQFFFGVVKFFDDIKGWGFIQPWPPILFCTQDVFVHYSCIQQQGHRSVKQGDHVWFQLVYKNLKPRAHNVILVAFNY
eukprot:snap_masked-scaffold_9-processed-gene-2.56-mRNA-1 protein AED:0.05 eAED:0.05 QI:0/-1/0/1/-1/1/1/0/79